MFYFSKIKGDQLGDKLGDPWHIYLNPKNPELCPVLALEKYLISHPNLCVKCHIFPGNNQYYRFIRIFHRFIHDKKETFHIIGVEEHSLGSHSCRKGSITLCSYGCTVSIPMVSICLRGCWSMGPVKDWYIHYKNSHDKFTGRSVTAISYLTKEFTISPPRWDFTDSIEEGMEDKVDQLLSNNLVR